MSVLDRIAFYQGRRDETPNQDLARELVANADQVGIQEIAANLWHSEPNVRSDCLKVLYEIGYLAPEWIAPYAADFLKLLRSRNNRLVWGAMIALSTIAGLAADELYPHVADIQRTMATGSVITMDAGVLALARLAATRADRRAAIFPYLREHLRTCRPKDAPQHAEKTLLAVTATEKDAYIAVLEARLTDATPPQRSRLQACIRAAAAR